MGTNQMLDADNDGIEGGSFTLGGQALDAFYRKFGDVDGDYDVDHADLAQFQAAMLSQVGQPAYDPRFDADGDGDVDYVDRARFFRNYRGTKFIGFLTPLAPYGVGTRD
ncbi:MAG TPA: dockerin type I domain-containing protein, partial [Pirellulaceae bacterium]